MKIKNAIDQQNYAESVLSSAEEKKICTKIRVLIDGYTETLINSIKEVKS